jgi:hypothetical protein
MPLSVTITFILLSVILLNVAYILLGVTTKSILQFVVLPTVLVLNVSP